ncbi:hypothetical protein JTE90_015760 [Oedothorax gibbosus]|uniref:Uncharacterized protein n=1 Tax=Oedothorax gibbosus TaxID=931172 RepID=A0AAV6VYN7_9ARAC|nr:hypothetical protein JTE90_015760 [Oedothorax gibbosus]
MSSRYLRRHLNYYDSAIPANSHEHSSPFKTLRNPMEAHYYSFLDLARDFMECSRIRGMGEVSQCVSLRRIPCVSFNCRVRS